MRFVDLKGDGLADLVAKSADGALYTILHPPAGGGGNGAGQSNASAIAVGGPASASLPAEFTNADVGVTVPGFAIVEEDAGDQAGFSLAAGDVNGDGFDDLIIGAPLADGPGNTRANAGAAYVVFGSADPFPAQVNLSDIAAGAGGFIIHGEDVNDAAGYSVAAGDVNGDGFDDIVVGAPDANSPFSTNFGRGQAYVVFGSATTANSANQVTHAGTAAGETLTGDASANVMVGGAGNDTINGNGGADSLAGGQGDDTLSVADANFRRIVGGTGFDTLAFAGAGTLADSHFGRIEEIEAIRLANAATSLTLGVHASYAIDGLAAHDFGIPIDVSAVTNAAVAINGAVLNRRLALDFSANAAAVTLTGGFANDIFTGGAAADSLLGGGGDDLLTGRGGNDTLNGGAGSDTVSYSGATQPVVVNLTAGTASGAEIGTDTLIAIENAIGGSGADTLTGNALANVLEGGGGNDTINGAGGIDTASFAGALQAVSVNLAAVLNQATGADIGADQVSNVENVRGGAGADTITGNAGINVLDGGDNNDLLDGGGGGDTLIGGFGNDSYLVRNAGDTIVELANQGGDWAHAGVSYTLAAGAHVENLGTMSNVGTGAIDLTGNELAQVIWGNDGANVLNGGGGNDTINGRGGPDVYLFDTALDASTNVVAIVGYSVDDDVVHLDDAVFVGLAAGALDDDAFHIGSAAADAEDRIIYDGATGALSFDADGDGAGAAIRFATLSPGLAMNELEFLVV